MSLYRELSYDGDIDVVRGVQFSVMSPEDIERRSVAEICKTDTYNGSEPVPHGLFDPRMGVIDHNKTCITCEQRNTFCPGHFGHIKLHKPVFYVQYFPMVKNLLKCVCYRCSKLLIDPAAEEALQGKKCSRQKRFETVYKLCQRVKRCGQFTQDGCGAKQPTITKEGMLKIAFEWKDGDQPAAATAAAEGEAEAEVEAPAAAAAAAPHAASGSTATTTKHMVSAEEALRILRRISDRDAEALGLSKRIRPEYLVCTVLPVPPPAVRPSVRNDTGQRSEDDLTHKLSMIIKVNNNLGKQVAKGAADQVAMITMLLQYEVATFIDNTIPGMPPSQQRTGRPIRSLTERLKGKEGRIRGNLMGKRVDFSARSVITPDPTISIDELGVPQKIAMNLTFPDVVHALNVEELRRAVLNGPELYPGAKYVRKTREGRTIRLQSIDRAAVQLELGDVVDRHLRDGDVVLFNRQPSLHKCSMMAHRVRVMPGSTFRLNVMVTPCFNADFDGDEMNMHVPQSLQSHEELLQLAAVPTQIVSQRECKPIVSIVQDIVTGLYRLTKDSTTLTEKQVANLLALDPRCAGVVPAPGVGGRLWSGRQLLSAIVPPRINADMKTGQYDETKGDAHNAQAVVRIRNGAVLSGAFDKDVYQARTKGLVHSIVNEYGVEEARRFFDCTQKLICGFLVLNGFSVGISDLVVDAATQARFLASIRDMKTEVYKVLQQLQEGRFENKSTKSNAEAFERQVNDLLNRAVQSVGKQGAQQLDDEHNRMINMIRSKAKGNNINVSQMIGCLGQQNVDGKRIADNWEGRTLPHFCKYDDGPESRGFVESSFIRGLNPQEYYFHAMGGREGIIDTAVQTSETGYIQRKLVKAMEDCKVNFDGSVRNAAGAIVQFLYGDDGMDGAKVEAQTVPYMALSHADFVARYDLTGADGAADPALRARLDAHLARVQADREFLIRHIFHGKQESGVMYPVSFFRIISMAKGDMEQRQRLGGGREAQREPPLTAAHVLDALDAMERDLYISRAQRGNQLFHILARAFLSPKPVLHRHRLDREAFDAVVAAVRQRFQDSMAHPGELVGVVAATSIGEPSTQLVLNSVEYDTGLVLRVNGELRRVKIGEFIDNHIDQTLKGSEARRGDLEQHPNDTWLGWLRDAPDGRVEVLSCDKAGKVAWCRVEAVTKHPVVNKDGTDTLLKVTLRSGRTVTATKAKSFLKRVDNEIVGVDGEDLRVGDYLPVSCVHPTGHDADIPQILNDHDIVPDVVLSSGTVHIHRADIPQLLACTQNGGDAAVLRNTLDEQIQYDEVVAIEEVRSERPYVYDLTVEGTRTFNTADGLALYDTFHSAGIAAASKTVRGVPRLKELLGVSKKIKTPCMRVFFKEEHRGDRNACRDLMNDLRTVRFRDLVSTSRIYFDPLDALPADAGFVGLYRDFARLLDGGPDGAPQSQPKLCAWVLRITFDRAAMLQYHTTMIGLHVKLLDAFGGEGISCMFSDDNAEELVMRIKLPLPTAGGGGGEAAADDMLTDIKALEHALMEGLVLKGVEGIEQAVLAKDEQRPYDPAARSWGDKRDEWVMVTDGSNLREMLGMAGVDGARTTTNNIVEVYDVLGIEAVRQALFNELAEVLDSIYVNYRHLSMLVDVQTNKGSVQSIDRHGINRADIGPLAKCSFEETTDKLIKAGIFAEQDKINGVSANIMLGQIPPAGTGDCEVLFDPSVLLEQPEAEDEAAEDEPAPGSEDIEDECTPDMFKIVFARPEF